MTEKRGETLVTGVSHRNFQSPACQSESNQSLSMHYQWHLVQVAVRVLCESFAAPLRSLNFVTLCPSNMYFLPYRTLKAVFVDKFGYSCTIDDLFDLGKKKRNPYHIRRVSS